jgi:uncharacterized membrane-anchored protein YjiN (DUF445 family)
MSEIIPIELILSKIYLIRSVKVMLDKDLAELYQVETRILNQSVRRNIKRFPADFMFQLTKKEHDNLKSQIVTSSWGGARKLPLAFSENGIAMLSSILSSDRAIQVNIQIMRTFTELRRFLSTHEELRRKIEEIEKRYDEQFSLGCEFCFRFPHDKIEHHRT